jgi:prepilin-type N-terminal cleavage/methylation domain-containing protein/prepilin-type processing-associated H-X9-DG protein
MIRSGLSLLELVVAIAIIGVLVAIFLPAVQSARESARRIQCQSNLRQIAVAMHNYEAASGMLPPGSCRGGSVFVALLPYMERQNLAALFDGIDWSVNDSEERFKVVDTTVIGVLLCPSDGASATLDINGTQTAGTNYAGNNGTWYLAGRNDGAFRAWDNYRRGNGPPFRFADFPKGASNVAAFSEILRADGSPDRKRVLWQSTQQYSWGAEIDSLADFCESLPRSPWASGFRGANRMHGTPWRQPAVAVTLYNHVARPNSPTCLNYGDMLTAAASVGCNHPTGIHVAFVDGHVFSVADSIDRTAWRNMGARLEASP